MLILLMLMGVLSPRRLWENVLLSLFSFLRSSLVTFHADDRRREKFIWNSFCSGEGEALVNTGTSHVKQSPALLSAGNILMFYFCQHTNIFKSTEKCVKCV